MPALEAPVRMIMLFAEDTHAAAAWWAAAFGATHLDVEEHPQGDFVSFGVAGVEVGFHVADPERNPVGGSPVVYWSVQSMSSACEELIGAGATPHRGPLVVDDLRRICQLRDPFGNVFGLDGPP